MKPTITLTAILTMFLTNHVNASDNICDNELGIEVPEKCASIAVSHDYKNLHNFRQLNPQSNQLTLKSGVLFRSDQFSEIDTQDMEKLSKLGIKTLIDLRSHDEIIDSPNKHIPTLEQQVNLPIGSDPADIKKLMPVEVAQQLRPLWYAGEFHKIDQLMQEHGVDLEKIRIERYQDFATKFTPQASRFLHLLADKDNYPIAFHCAGGKDRTGYMAAITLLALGFTADDVMNDYLTTNMYTYDAIVEMRNTAPKAIFPSVGAHQSQMEAALKQINTEFGSFDNYLKNVLKIDKQELEAIRKNLLI